MTNEERAEEVAFHCIDKMYYGGHREEIAHLILAALDAATAELEDERGRLREALKDAAIALAGAASAYSAYAGRSRSIKPRAKPDPFYTTRVRDLQEAADRARSALAKKDPSNG